MEEQLQTIVQALKDRFAVQEEEFLGQVILQVSADNLVEACRALRDELGFEMFSGSTAVDYWPQMEPRFLVSYMFLSIKKNLRLRFKVPVSGMQIHLPTIETIFPNANWYEREIFDMFGIIFDGHSDLRRILMPEDWEGYPLRKDYPLGYEEVQFTFNAGEVDLRKPYAKD